MAEVKWIKLNIDMFNNPKIKYLRTLPDGNSIVLVWVMLLTMAGRCNAGGMIFLTENVPYTTKMLADELGFDESVIQLAITALERLGMIQTDDFLTVTGWSEHQNVDGLDKIREQTRERVARYRANQKQLECNVTSNATVTHGNGTDIDKEEEKDLINNKRKRFTPPTVDEVRQYCKERKNQVDAERFVDFYTSKGWVIGKNSPMKDWKSAVRNWEKNSFTSGQAQQKKNDFHNFKQQDYDFAEIERRLDMM